MTDAQPANGEQPTLSDGVVTLRPWRRTDAGAVFAACQDPEIPRFVPVPQPYTLADAEAFVRQAREDTMIGPSAHFAIKDTASGTLLGAISRHARPGIPRASIGYWLAREARGRGVATKAVRLLVDWTFETTDTIRIEIYTDVDNVRSGRVALRPGSHPKVFGEHGTSTAADASSTRPSMSESGPPEFAFGSDGRRARRSAPAIVRVWIAKSGPRWAGQVRRGR